MAVVRIPLKDIKQLDIKSFKNGKTGSEIRNTYKPDALINLALYDMATKENIVFMEDDNKASGYLFSEYGIGITNKNTPVWCTFYDARVDDSVVDFVGGAPTLVVDSKVNILWGNKVSTQIQGKHIRTAIGFNNTELILYVSEDEITIDILAKRMLGYGCKFAINCDGGGSSYLYNKPTTYKSSVRANPTWLLVYKKEEVPVNKRYKICLDAGHGGSDPGATYNTFYEKDVALKVVNLMKTKLEPYVDIILTRTKDSTVSFEERVSISNKNNVDYFVSIHCNSAVNTAAKGWECHIVAKGGNAEKLAKKIRNVTMLNNSDILKDRGVKVSNFYVLRNTVAPAVLIENAFISNYDDRNNVLKSDTVLEKLASCYVKAILEMLNIKEIEPVKDSKDYEWALTVLQANGVINTKDYWLQNKTKLEYLEQLIINMSKYIEDNK